MPAPVSLIPPSLGDGSGICEREETERQRYERKKREARAEYWDAKVRAYKAKYAYPFGINGVSKDDVAGFFERVFGEMYD